METDFIKTQSQQHSLSSQVANWLILPQCPLSHGVEVGEGNRALLKQGLGGFSSVAAE